MKALVVLALLALGGVAQAEDFDPKGWTLLANKHVHAVEELEVLVPTFVGKVDRIAIVTLLGSVHVVSVETENAAGERTEKLVGVSLDLEHPSYEVRIPKQTRKLWVLLGEAVEGYTQLAVMGKSKTKAKRAKAAASSWSPEGWVTLDTSPIGSDWYGDFDPSDRETTFDRFAIIPSEEMLVNEVKLTVADGGKASWIRSGRSATWRRDEPQFFEVGSVEVGYVDFEYAIRGAFDGTVTLYGLPHTASASALVAESLDAWVADGWTLIGEDDVDLVDEELEIARDGATWGQVAIVTAGDDVHLDALAVDQKRFAVDADLASADSRVFDLAGKRRAISKVRLQYTKHRLDASTRVKVYAR